MIIDAHTHLGPFNKHIFTVDQLITSMEEASIDYSVVISDNHRNQKDGIDTDSLIALSKQYPQLIIIGEVRFDRWDKEQQDKLQRQLLSGEIHGVKLYPGYQNFYPFDERLFDLFSFCEKENKPIIVHTGLLNTDAPGSIKQPQPIHIDDVAQKFPNLKIVMAHMGYPWITDCAAVMYRNKNVYCDFSAFFPEYQHIAEKDIQSFIREMQTFKSIFGNFKKCLFGTDFPLYSQKEYIDAARQVAFTEEEKELVFSGNAIKVFGLKSK